MIPWLCALAALLPLRTRSREMMSCFHTAYAVAWQGPSLAHEFTLVTGLTRFLQFLTSLEIDVP